MQIKKQRRCCWAENGWIYGVAQSTDQRWKGRCSQGISPTVKPSRGTDSSQASPKLHQSSVSVHAAAEPGSRRLPGGATGRGCMGVDCMGADCPPCCVNCGCTRGGTPGCCACCGCTSPGCCTCPCAAGGPALPASGRRTRVTLSWRSASSHVCHSRASAALSPPGRRPQLAAAPRSCCERSSWLVSSAKRDTLRCRPPRANDPSRSLPPAAGCSSSAPPGCCCCCCCCCWGAVGALLIQRLDLRVRSLMRRCSSACAGSAKQVCVAAVRMVGQPATVLHQTSTHK